MIEVDKGLPRPFPNALTGALPGENLLPEPPPNMTAQIVGTGLEAFAHGLSLFRLNHGFTVKRTVEAQPDYQNWKTVGLFTLGAVSDWEGNPARLGRSMQNQVEDVPRPINDILDNVPDKVYVHATMRGIINRERANGYYLYPRLLEILDNIMLARDVATTADRALSIAQGVDTRAQQSGKNKAIWLYGTTGFAVSPLAKNKLGRAGVVVGFGICTMKSVSSSLALHEDFAFKRTRRRQERRKALRAA